MSLTNMYQLENLVIGLLEALNDKNSDVQESVSGSLCSLGNKKPDFVLKNSYQFFSKNLTKLSEGHKISILNTVEKIVKENITNLEESIAVQWIEASNNEMTQNSKDKEQPIQLQTASSDLLVAIGKKYVKEVFAQLQKNFVPGQLPHLFVVKTMANLSEVNPFGLVPNLTSILASMLPMIGMAKLDPYKCAIASAMSKFSEAIVYYCSNKEKAPDSSIEKSSFSTQIYAAHEVFFNSWLKTSDVKLRQLVIEAIGHFSILMPREKLESDLAKIFPGLLGLYKKHPDHFVVSQSLYLTISTVVTTDPPIVGLDNLFDTLIKEMFAQVLISVEQQFNKNTTPANSMSLVKNQNELLRCFAELAKRYSDKIVPFLVQKFEQKDEKTRTSSLIVLKHLINSCDEEMSNKKQLVISGLRLLLNETSNRVKKNLLQVIIAMAYHDYLSLEGGNSMIEFILKQSTLPETDPNDKKQANQLPDDCSNDQLKSSADSILTLFSTTVENMHQILWPHLLEYTTLNEYSRSISQLCKNIAHIADIKRSANSDDFLIQYDQFINLPKPLEILARLIVLCGVPLANKNRGLNILNLMKNFSPNLNSSIVELWDNVVPKLIINLEDKIQNSKFNQKTWEDLIMKLLSNTIDQIGEEEKICEIAKAFGAHIETLYINSVDEKYFAYKCLGIALNKTTSKTTIDRQLDIMFNTINHSNQTEREGFAISFGYCGSVHLDTVLLKLETFAKNETKKSSGGLFSSILKDSKSADPELVKATLVLAYGYVTHFAQKDLIISRLETYILRNVGGYASGVIRDVVLKQNILKSIDLITKCMHHDHLQKEFSFSYKTNLLNQIIAYISNDNSKLITNDIKAQCFKVCSNIVKLNPKPTEADMYQLVKTSTDSFFVLQVPTPDENQKKLDAELDATTLALNEINQMHGNSNYEMTAKALDELMQSILNRDLTNDGCFFIFKYLEPWIISVNDHERLRSSRCLANLLKHFSANFQINLEEQTKKPTFDSIGHILGLIAPRITDPIISVRLLTIDSIESLLKALITYGENESLIKEQEKHFEQLNLIKQKLTKSDSNILLSAVSDLAKQLCKILPNVQQSMAFVEKLIDGLLDIQSHCSSASCIFLNAFIKMRGNELKDQVENIIRHLYSKLGLIQNQQTKQGTLRTIRIIFQQHLMESLNVILTFPIPCNKDFIDICQALCEDSQLIQDILDNLLQIWNQCLPYEEKNNIKYASLTPLIGTCILSEIFSNNTTANTEQVFNQNFEKIFSALMVRISSTLSNQMPIPKSKDDSSEPSSPATNKKDDSKNATKSAIQAEYRKLEPCKISIDCFKSFIKCTQNYDLFEYLENENVWDLLIQESTNVEGCYVLARGLCLHGQKHIANIINNLNEFLSSPYDCQKKSATAFYAELINHECILSHVEQLMNNLLSKLIDPHTPIRTLCIRGLGNIASLGKEEVQKHSTTILSAMMAGLDDKDDFNDDITLESMNGLTKIIALIDENNVRPILINILLRIRPCFEKDKGTIRASAYLLFGELARFAKGPSKDPYMEQIHSNFVSFILHLNESDESVKKACKSVLRSVGPLIESNLVNDLFQTILVDNKSFHYGEFINDLSKLLVSEFPEKISFYIMNSVSNFKSQWTEIRCNAVLFAGFMLGHLTKEKQSLLSKEHISNALIKLLREDQSSQVRQKAAEAISLLSDF